MLLYRGVHLQEQQILQQKEVQSIALFSILNVTIVGIKSDSKWLCSLVLKCSQLQVFFSEKLLRIICSSSSSRLYPLPFLAFGFLLVL